MKKGGDLGRWTQRAYVLTQWPLTLRDSVDCSFPGPSVHEILQASSLEWVAMPFSRGSSRPTSPAAPALAGGFFTTGKPQMDTDPLLNQQVMGNPEPCPRLGRGASSWVTHTPNPASFQRWDNVSSAQGRLPSVSGLC